MNSVHVELTQEEKASRVEVIVRILYFAIFCIIGGIFGGIVMYILWPLNLLLLLLLGKRILGLTKFIGAFIKYATQYYAYLMGTTDERPPIVPEL